jgi:hypothetical protein
LTAERVSGCPLLRLPHKALGASRTVYGAVEGSLHAPIAALHLARGGYLLILSSRT